MKRSIANKLISSVITISVIVGTFTFVNVSAIDVATGICEGFENTGFTDVVGTAPASNSKVGNNITVNTGSIPFLGVVDGNEMDSKKLPGDSALKILLKTKDSQVILNTAPNAELAKGDIYTCSFEYARSNQKNGFVFSLNATAGGVASSNVIFNPVGTNTVYKSNSLYYDWNGTYLIAFSNWIASDKRPVTDFRRFDFIINTCDEQVSGKQTLAIYRDGILLQKGIFNLSDASGNIINEPITRINSTYWKQIVEKPEEDTLLYLDNIRLEKTPYSTLAKDGLYKNFTFGDLQNSVVSSYSYNKNTLSANQVITVSDEVVNKQTLGLVEDADVKKHTFTIPVGATRYDSTVMCYRNADGDNRDAINLEAHKNKACAMLDIMVPTDVDLNSYYLFLGASPNEFNNWNVSGGGVKLNKYYTDSDRNKFKTIKIPLSDFANLENALFPYGGIYYPAISLFDVDGVGIACMPASDVQGVGRTENIYVGNTCIVRNIESPSNILLADMNDGSITVKWTPSRDTVAAYEIYRDDKLIASVDNNVSEYSDINLKNDMTYIYKIRTKSVFGTYTEYTQPLSVYLTAVGKPKNLSANNIIGSTLSVKLEWSAPDFGNVKEYEISRNGSVITKVAAGGSDFQYIDTANLTPNTFYEYGVVSISDKNSRSLPESVKVFVAYVLTPENFKFTINQQPVLTWDAVGNAQFYNVYLDNKKIATVNGNSYVCDQRFEYFKIYNIYVTAVTMENHESLPSMGVLFYIRHPKFNQEILFYKDGFGSDMTLGFNNTTAVEYDAFGNKFFKLDFPSATEGNFTIKYKSPLNIANIKNTGGSLFLAVYAGDDTNLDEINVGLSYSKPTANSTPLISSVPLGRYVSEKNKWVMAEVPINDLPKTVTYLVNNRTVTEDFSFALATGLNVISDRRNKENSSVILVDNIFMGSYQAATVKLLKSDGSELGLNEKVDANAEFIKIRFDENMDASTFSGNSVKVADANSNPVLISYDYNESDRCLQINFLSPLTKSANYSVTISGAKTIKGKGGGDINAAFSVNSNEPNALKTEVMQSKLNIDSENVQEGSSAKAVISVENITVSPLNVSDIELNVNYDASILSVDKKSISLLGNLSDENTQVTYNEGEILIKSSLNKPLTLNSDLLAINFYTHSYGNAKISVNVSLNNKFGNIINKIILPKAEETISVSKARSGGNGGGSGVNGYGGNRESTVISSANIPAAEPEIKRLSDVDQAPWAKEAINYLYDKKLVLGYPDKTFKPNNEITREEFASMLITCLDIKADGDCDFVDVKKDEWYYTAVAAAFKNNIVNGYGDNSFGIGEKITREDMCVMISRAANVAKVPLEGLYGTMLFDDNDYISDYARDAVRAMQQAGIVNGVTNTMFAPKDKLTKAMAAKVIYEILKLKG